MKSTKTTPLLSVEQGITAMKRADEVGRNYHPGGGDGNSASRVT